MQTNTSDNAIYNAIELLELYGYKVKFNPRNYKIILCKTFDLTLEELSQKRCRDLKLPTPIYLIGTKYYTVKNSKPTVEGFDWKLSDNQMYTSPSKQIWEATKDTTS